MQIGPRPCHRAVPERGATRPACRPCRLAFVVAKAETMVVRNLDRGSCSSAACHLSATKAVIYAKKPLPYGGGFALTGKCLCISQHIVFLSREAAVAAINMFVSNSTSAQVRKLDSVAVVDLFCGAGGLTHGFFLEGFNVVAGIDMDKACRFPYEANNNAAFICKDVAEIHGADILRLYGDSKVKVLVGCAPCQPFSTYNQKNEDSRWQLLNHFARLIEEVAPDVISMENVPALQHFQSGQLIDSFVQKLQSQGYHVFRTVASCTDFGVPQNRKRLVLLASKWPGLVLECSPVCDSFLTVWGAISRLPPIKAGETHPHDPLHRSSSLSELNLARIRASKPGGTWRDWDETIVSECHKSETGKSYGSVYGRMRWDQPAPTITTQFYGFGSGRFGHPVQDRALSLREGAILQSFPPSYQFIEPGQEVYHTKTLARLIGNAVPVGLARGIAQSIQKHLNHHQAV